MIAAVAGIAVGTEVPPVAATAVASVASKAPAPTSRNAPPNAAPTAAVSRSRAVSTRRRASTPARRVRPPRPASTTLRASPPHRGRTTTTAATTTAAHNNGRSNGARQYTAPRAYSNNGRAYNNRSYAYSKPGYAPPRAPYYRGHAKPYYGKPYYGKPYYAKPYYYHGYRGVYGYGGGYRHTRIVTVYPWRPYYYRPHFSIGVYYGAGGVYDYGYTPSYYYDPIPGRTYGGVRITEAPRDAQVFADGYYVGIVDDFDGAFQHVNLEAGQHRIEVRAAGIPPISFDVYIQPGRTITLRADDYNDGYAGNADVAVDGY